MHAGIVTETSAETATLPTGTPIANPEAGTPRPLGPPETSNARTTTATAPAKEAFTVASPVNKISRMKLLKHSIIPAAPDAFFLEGMTPPKETVGTPLDCSLPAIPDLGARSITGDSPVASDSMPCSKVDEPASAELSSTAAPTPLESRSVSARSSSETSDNMLDETVAMPVSDRLTCAATHILNSDHQSRESRRPSWSGSISESDHQPTESRRGSISSESSAASSDSMPSEKVGMQALPGMTCKKLPVLEPQFIPAGSPVATLRPKIVVPKICWISKVTPMQVSRSISADPYAVRNNRKRCSRVGKPASGRSSSMATSMRSHSVSADLTGRVSSSGGSSMTGSPHVRSFIDVVSSSVAPENVPNVASEPAIFVSYLVEKIIGSGIVGIQNGSSIKRQINSETGEGQTIVTDENGRSSTFSQETVSSVMTGAFRAARVLPKDLAHSKASLKEHAITRDEKGCIKAIDGEMLADFFDETIMRSWIGSLPKIHLMGFDQELRIRLSNLWTEYSKIKAEHEDYLENADYIFFGLDKNSTLKDLERAFRRLAREMHPDKNGGSDEAKARFQDLKERYEKLKRKMQCEKGKQCGEEDEQKELLDEGQEFCEQPESTDTSKEDANSGATDQDLDRDTMEKKIWEVLDAAKVMQRQMQAWKDQLDKAVQAQ